MRNDRTLCIRLTKNMQRASDLLGGDQHWYLSCLQLEVPTKGEELCPYIRDMWITQATHAISSLYASDVRARDSNVDLLASYLSTNLEEWAKATTTGRAGDKR